MNKDMYRFRYIWGAVQAFCLGTLFSCTQEDGGDVPGGVAETAAVTLQVGATGNVQTRAYGGDGAAVAGEFMNSLDVFIVDDRGMVEKVIHAADSASFEPEDGGKGGCGTAYSTTVVLRTGAKTIYAFANMEGYMFVGGGKIKDKLDGVAEGSLWADAGLDGAVVDDPASAIDLERVFIPMSVRREVSVPVSDGKVQVELVRLVGKVRPRLTNDKGERSVRVTSLSIGRFADRVALFEGQDAESAEGDKQRVFTLDQTVGTRPVDLYGFGVDGQAVLKTEGGMAVPEIYVNETYGAEPFDIKLTVDGEEMGGKTVTHAVPRNHYLPLALNLSDFQITVEAYVAPIGGYPVAVTTGPSLTDHYEVSLPEGCTFSVNGTFGRAAGEDLPVTAWKWTVPEGQNTVGMQGGLDDVPLWGNLAAMPGRTVTLDFEVTSPRAKSGTLTLATEALGDMDEYGVHARGAVRWTESQRRYERVRMGDVK